MTATLNSDQKLTQLRIERALAKPGAVGMKGILLWAEAAFPKALIAPVLKAAGRYTPGAGVPVTLASPQAQGFGHLGCAAPPSRLGFLGDSGSLIDVSFDPGLANVSDSASQAIDEATQAPVSGVTAATSSQPATPSWAADIGSAFSAAAQASLGVIQAIDAQKLFNTNLHLATSGKSMIPLNPTQYGLPAPTANIGLAPSAQRTLLIAGGLVVAAMVALSLSKRSRK